jgi:lipopolysaccharide transport system ATP-binding protein
MTKPVISIEGLSKRFIIGENIHGTGARTFRDIFDHKIRKLLHGKKQAAAIDNVIWALRDVSFDVDQGDVIGVIGRNGAGKSTLLKILSRITEPTKGRVTMRGRVASLLEVGTGFNYELTGRENIYLNGAILGMRKAEIDKKFDEIVEFAEVAQFVDTPVKRYSSGMFLRLAFSVAAHLEPEVLIVDEVLAVGDVQFQKKCMGKMKDVSQNQGRTVLFVSHNMDAIAQLCKKCALLEKGHLKVFSETDDVIRAYLKPEATQTGTFVNPKPASDADKIHLESVKVMDAAGRITPKISSGDTITVQVEYTVHKEVEDARVGIMLKNHQGIILVRNGDADVDLRHYEKRSPGRYVNSCAIPTTVLKNGDYFLTVFSDIPMREWLFYEEDVLAFEYQDFANNDVVFHEYPTGLMKFDFHWDVAKHA